MRLHVRARARALARTCVGVILCVYKITLCGSSVEPRGQQQQVQVQLKATLNHWTSVEMPQSAQLMNAIQVG